jgi:tRNA(fMet)-specific endonuclease VapC
MTTSGVDPIRRLVLDTSAYSQMRAGHETAIDLIARAEIVFVPTVVLGELEGGFEIGRHAAENRRTLAEFLSEPFVAVLPATAHVARHYGRVYAQLRKSGTPIPSNDMWIAAATLDCGGHLLTFDNHFHRIPFLPCSVLEA